MKLNEISNNESFATGMANGKLEGKTVNGVEMTGFASFEQYDMAIVYYDFKTMLGANKKMEGVFGYTLTSGFHSYTMSTATVYDSEIPVIFEYSGAEAPQISNEGRDWYATLGKFTDNINKAGIHLLNLHGIQP